MKRIACFVMIGFAALLLTAETLCAQTSGDTPRRGCRNRFISMDVNGDGMITMEEFLRSPHYRVDPESRFNVLDSNGNGSLTVQEFCSNSGRGQGSR